MSGILVLTPSIVLACPLQQLTYITEDYPPHNFMKNGTLQGVSVDLLVIATKSINCPITAADIKLMPWTRGYNMALNRPNIVLFGMTKIKEREKLFKWVCSYMNTQVVLTARKDAGINIRNKNDLNRLTIGVVKDDIAEKLFRGLDLNPDNFKYGNNHPETLAKMLVSHRFDAWGYDINVASWILTRLGYNLNDFETIYSFKPVPTCYAFSKSTADTTVQLLQKAFNTVYQQKGKSNNTLLKEIYAKYGLIN
ncbi:substrate-binding periplasmic protein [Spartinivicinus poritis]|uniref:Transporter substrate-binding domain-containing protein n=1 Tax=Spartinivicinus poritis TaxID=2994640 RepID=A0ABT5UCB9_9GAMM|nr:transporter substrate-binding domain-containing protein [Spartinivicinus sp. A2-2]MDE1463636.1 transporter substrate-binding domain-containing protein [Spartinivicinus sp. A2-2]